MNERERFEEKWAEDPLSTASVCGSPLIAESYKEVARKYFQAGRADAMAWRPIESAPKDGTHIIGFAGGTITTVYWFQMGKYWSLVQCGSHCEDDEWSPTLWMPLPEPPKCNKSSPSEP